MWSVFRLFLIVVLLAGCSSVAVYSPLDASDQPTGTVTGLKVILQRDPDPVVLVFVHGVGDHCRGYALGDEHPPAKNSSTPPVTPWLDREALDALGFEAVGSSQSDSQITAQELPIGKAADATTNVVLIRERKYVWTVSKSPTPLKVDVRAVEVTWSPTTRWIKNTLLGYDAANLTPVNFKAGGPDIETCSNDPVDTVGNQAPVLSGFQPTPRLAGNGILKWGVLDRSLADALIYSGSYGMAMQRGVAQALCRIVGGTFDGVTSCKWPTTPLFNHTHFVFVTHSLGSRLLYDTMLNLKGSTLQASKYPNLFPPSYVTSATPTIEAVVNQTAGLYMMANQLTMLGLANVPWDARFGEQINFVAVAALGPALMEAAAAANTERRLASVIQVAAVNNDPLVQLLDKRTSTSTLVVTSFNDTNDLLTWHLPAWYAVSIQGTNTGVQVADAFVKNATHWLELAEWPPSAHGDYFINSKVWGVMFCGAAKGRAVPCE